MKIIIFLLVLLSPGILKSQLVHGYSRPNSEAIFYDTSKVIINLHETDTLVMVRVLGIKPQALKAQRYKHLRDIPLKYVKYYEFWQVHHSEIGTCSLPCSRAFYPVFKNVVARKVEEKYRQLEERERFIEKHFPTKSSE